MPHFKLVIGLRLDQLFLSAAVKCFSSSRSSDSAALLAMAAARVIPVLPPALQSLDESPRKPLAAPSAG